MPTFYVKYGMILMEIKENAISRILRRSIFGGDTFIQCVYAFSILTSNGNALSDMVQYIHDMNIHVYSQRVTFHFIEIRDSSYVYFLRFNSKSLKVHTLPLLIEVMQYKCILKGKRNAYYDFQNVGFILRTNFVLIPAIYTHWYRQWNSSTNLFNFCWWRIPLAMTALSSIGVHRIYVKETRAWKQITFEENGSLNNFPP